MEPEPQPNPNPTWMVVIGWILSVLASLVLVASGVVKMLKPDDFVKNFSETGYKESSLLFLGCIEVACVIVFLFPRTAILGAILLTGYLGGATATHVRITDPFYAPVVFGMVIWFAVYLRDSRLRALIPLRRDPAAPAPAGGVLSVILNTFIFLVVMVVIVAGIAALQPAEFRVTRSATIDAPPSEVFPHVNDFHQWDDWSPWKKLDPAAKNTFEGPPAGKDAHFHWSGNDKIGEGMMTIKESVPNEKIGIKLEFIKPFKNVADTDFTFKAQDGKTVVTWTMASEPSFLFKTMGLFMNTEKMVGSSFEEGLNNLKTVVEKENKK